MIAVSHLNSGEDWTLISRMKNDRCFPLITTNHTSISREMWLHVSGWIASSSSFISILSPIRSPWLRSYT